MPASHELLPVLRAIVERLHLLPHPEGGYFRETYRATVLVDTPRGPRAASTAIFYLLEAGDCSRLHRIASDEAWHFYEGDPLEVVVLDTAKEAGFVLSKEHPQDVVVAGRWFGARVRAGTHGYALVGCTVAPGFDFADFELAEPDALLAEFPHASETIITLT